MVVQVSLEERVQELEWREAIRRLIADYCHGVDKHDVDRFMNIWQEDAAWEIGGPFGDYYGKAEVRHCLVDLIWPALPETHHWTTNLVLEFDGSSAKGMCDVDCTATDSEGRPLLIAASYFDDYERRDGDWKIAKRKVELFYQTPVLDPWSNTPESRFRLPKQG
ncbi:MAG: nuclear transport factor 2 family protein [Dehalococcoidia bacterium]